MHLAQYEKQKVDGFKVDQDIAQWKEWLAKAFANMMKYKK